MRAVRTLVYSGVGMFTHALTGRQCPVTWEVYDAGAEAEPGSQWFYAVYDGRPHTPQLMNPAEAALMEARLFPEEGPPPDHRLPDPINLDGSGRNALKDKMAKRGLTVESMAAD